MTSRHALRFLSGEREGETVELTGSSFTIGRRPGNSLQILDPSVSGKHLELVPRGDVVALRDLGSTNGTRVDGQRVIEIEVRTGTEVVVGNVRLRLVDPSAGGSAGGGDLELELPDAAPAASAGAPPAGGGDAGGAGEGATRVRADLLERARKGSRGGLLALLVLLLAGGGAAWWFLGRGGAGGARSARTTLEVASVPGDLLGGDGSFEQDGGWTPDDEAGEAFVRVAGARATGRSGYRATPGEDEVLGATSDEVRVAPRSRFRAQVDARVASEASGASARLGVQLSSSEPEGPATFSVWSDATTVDGFETLVVIGSTPPGYDRARLLLRASGAGEVDFDDASLVASGQTQPLAEVDAFGLHGAGEPVRVVALYEVQRALITGLRRRDDAGTDGELTAVAEGDRLRVSGAGDGAWTWRAEPRGVGRSVRTLGADGSVTHRVAFEREGVDSLLLGSGPDLVAVRFPGPVTLSGSPVGEGWRFQASGADRLDLQVRFGSELTDALTLASRARKAQQDGDVGQAMQLWQRLLDELPYDADSNRAAEQALVDLERQGREELGELEQQVERARFFRLVESYREVQGAARALARRYAGSDLEAEAEALAESVDGALSALERDLDRHEVQRLRAILQALELQGSTALAAEVRATLRDEYGEGQ